MLKIFFVIRSVIFAYQVISEDVEAYLSTRPARGDIIGAFAPNLDPTRAYFEHVKIVAGFIFMLSEQQQAEKHLQEQLDNFDPTTLLEGDE